MLLKMLSRLKSYGIFHRNAAKKITVSIRSNVYSTVFQGGNRIYSGCSISNVTLGYGTYVADNTKIAYATIGKYCSIGPGCRVGGLGKHPTVLFTSHPAFYSNKGQSGFNFSDSCLFVEHEVSVIGHNVWIGAGCIVLDGVTLGNNVIVAAGAVVTKSFGDDCIIGGVPARIIRQRDTILDYKWWDCDLKMLADAVKHSSSANFIDYNQNFLKYIYENESK